MGILPSPQALHPVFGPQIFQDPPDHIQADIRTRVLKFGDAERTEGSVDGVEYKPGFLPLGALKLAEALLELLASGFDDEKGVIDTRAEGIIEGEDIVCRIPTSIGTTVAGLHPATGGDGSKACSADMLMESLVACAGVTLKAVATAMRIPLKRAKVIAEGNWDARGTLGIDRAATVGLKEVRLTFEIDSPADPEKIEKLVQLTERFCVIYQTLANPPKLTSHYRALSPV